MKRIFLAITALFAFALTSHAQFEFEPDGGGFGGPVQPDLVIQTVNMTGWNPAYTINIPVTVRNRHNAVAVAASKIRIRVAYNPPGQIGTSHGNVIVNVPAFAQWEIDKVVSVTWNAVPPGYFGLYGSWISIVNVTADWDNEITEAYENNNVHTPGGC